MTVNRDRDPADPAAGAAASDTVAVTSADSGAEPRGAGSAAWVGEEADGRALRAQARREQRRSTILAAATRVFKEKGYHATSVNDIIDAAQIARGTFYLYFTSKREVFAELSATFLELIRSSVRKISLDAADGDPLSQMRANFRRVMNTVLAHADLATVMLRSDGGDAEARAQLDLFYQQVIALIGQAVRVGHALGFARDCDVQVIAVAALAGLKEVLGRMLDARPGADPDPEADPEANPEAAAPTQSSDLRGVPAPGGGSTTAASPWRMAPERLADELLTFFVRGVFTQ